MRFTLHYEGPLPTKASAETKARIREVFAPQLKELWSEYPLSQYKDDYLQPVVTEGGLSALHDRFGHTFASICSAHLGIGAELDILMLRAAAPGGIVVEGDIDNRLKTLFDALSAPAQSNQITPSMRETSIEDPLFVLLDDDRLISRVSVETERLLAPTSSDIVHLYIRVNTTITRAMWGNLNL